MTLRRRLIVATALAVALAVTLACAVAYLVVRNELRDQVDQQLTSQARLLASGPLLGLADGTIPTDSLRLRQPSPAEGGPFPYFQLLDGAGAPNRNPALNVQYRLAVDDADRAIARNGGPSLLRSVEQGNASLRQLTVALPSGRGAVQLARPLDGVDTVLRRLGLVLALVCAGGVALAALLGRLVTRRVTAPLREVAAAAGHIAETDELGARLAIHSRDEVGQIADRFNSMLDRLESSRGALRDSVTAQRQLVADASHELRTPITSLRTNIEVLLEGQELDPLSRRQLLDDVRGQIEELGALVVDVIELARGDAQPPATEPLRLDEVTEAAVERVRRHHPDVHVVLEAIPVDLDGDRARLSRAIGNLLENASKHAPPGTAVEVGVDAAGVSVRDHGPGVDPDDLPSLFDRFYRGSTGRELPGTGLGLAIVRQVAEAHGGSVSVENAAPDGARFRLRLAGRPPEPPAIAAARADAQAE